MLPSLVLIVSLADAAAPADAAVIAAAARARPAVAHVEVEQGVSWTPVLQELLSDFKIPPRLQPRDGERASGSAVLISADGRALTNHHVVAGAPQVTLVLPDQRRYVAEVLGSDARTDLAVLQVRADAPLPWLPLGDSSTLRVGQMVLAVGSPFDFTSTTTLGIVSYLGRRGLDPKEIQDYIQTDAAVNPGNSGGPLVSLRGEVVGINTAIYSQSGDQSAGVSFAIPSNMAARVARDLLADGRVRRARIGLQLEDAEAVDGDPTRRGARVTWVQPQSPAALAGLRRGDVVVQARGEAISSAAALRDLVRARGVGSELVLRVVRGMTELQVMVKIAEDRAIGVGLPAAELPAMGVVSWGGAQITDPDPSILARLGVGDGDGPVVARVEPGSPAAELGVVAGDRLVALRGRQVRDLAELRKLMDISGPTAAVVGLARAGAVVRTVLPPP